MHLTTKQKTDQVVERVFKKRGNYLSNDYGEYVKSEVFSNEIAKLINAHQKELKEIFLKLQYAKKEKVEVLRLEYVQMSDIELIFTELGIIIEPPF